MNLILKRYQSKPLYLHTYFFFIYILGVLAMGFYIRKPLTILCLFGFFLSFLGTFWSTKILIFQCFSNNPNGPFLLYKNKLCLIKCEGKGVESFLFNREKFLLIDQQIISLSPNIEISFEKLRKGPVIENYHLYPPNEFLVPRPSFFTLFKEQCVSPLFSFQVTSSLLMCFDEHIMSSLISTAMIIFVEATFVLSRVSTMKIFRKLEHKTYLLKRLNRGDGKLISETVSSVDLRPGDKIVIDSPINLPCDMVILEGSCAVNEAMLSGESVPLFKEELIGKTPILNLKEHKKHILFAGTSIEKLYSPMTSIVLRTSYNTEQGMLLNKMLHSDDIKYDPEALKFILSLSLISLINCFFTFKYSKKTGYPLFIDLIILFTNTIPFELPMEMGLSIQSAVKNLMSKKVYCLEPFRITLAGKVDVCCFDKTGTLVDSKLEVKKVVFSNENTGKVLTCCQNLIDVDGVIKGDPLDMAIFLSDFEKVPYKILQQFSFTSELKRQGVVAEIGNSKNKLMFCMKGAPEQIEKHLKVVPSTYTTYKKYATEGHRVIALACKELSIHDIKLSPNRLTDRAYLEKDLEFCGFALLGSSLREYANEMCTTLREAGLKVLMITGDNLLTAISVADQLNIKGKGVEGHDIDKVLNDTDFKDYSIFGRADPRHKELIIKKYQSLGFHTMMVGDGTNDVGALKSADVGVAMLEPEEVVSNVQAKKTQLSFFEQIKSDAASLESIKPGDASMAAPFTVKSNSLKSIINIIQQGRSSLVTTIQMYKILALNSIISAFLYMVLDILGVKFSDPQMVSIGILSSIGFTAITQPKSLESISTQRPITSIFSLYIFSSILSQSIIQVSSLYLVYKNIPCPKPAEKFEPSELNTVLFIVSSIQTITVLICNYIGRPFREDLFENKLLGFSILAIFGFISNIFLKFHPDLNELINVVDIAKHIKFVVPLCVSIIILCYICEKISFRLFMIKRS
ncbi:uncharacterized protein LOC143921930 [Arctopsyche grandis]|uniref:uncharacterized protein LOC143921930 n=1 Tax=Arctopsyche grandis TaxID=121162 RepID=UPI00406D7AC8